jgi:hypothetical protein
MDTDQQPCRRNTTGLMIMMMMWKPQISHLPSTVNNVPSSDLQLTLFHIPTSQSGQESFTAVAAQHTILYTMKLNVRETMKF